MTEPGNFPELSGEIQRLRRAGLPDLAIRPRRYPGLTAVLAKVGAQPSAGLLARLDGAERLFTAALARLPSDQLREAARILFHVGRSGTPLPLDQRRKAADRAFTGRGFAREPDTIQRFLERDLLDPLLIEALLSLPVRRPEPVAGVDSGAEIAEVDRREFLRDLSAAGILVGLRDPAIDWDRIETAGTGQVRIDALTVDGYTALNGLLWNAFAASRTKGALFRPVRNQVHALAEGFRRSPGPALHRRMCALLADLLQLAGEVFLDLNRYPEAAHCYATAAMAGKEAGAFDLWACALTRHAFISVYERQFGSAASMLDVAGHLARRGDPTLSTRHWVSAVQAQALAGLGDLAGHQRAIGSAEQVGRLTGPVHNGGWLRFDGSRLPEERGACYVELNRPDLAEPFLTEALKGNLSARRQGCVLADLAMAGAQRRDVDQVLAFASDAADIARETGSGVVGQKLGRLRERLVPFLADKRTAELRARITRLCGSPTT